MLAIKCAVALLTLLCLVFLYRKLPNHRIFAIFCGTLFAASALVFWSWPKQEQPAAITEEQRNDILQQQQIFTAWYNDYKKSLDQLDHNWQQYHNILENFKEDNISIQTTYVRLTQLEKDAAQTRDQLGRLNPPLELDSANYDLVTAILKKANTYANTQYQAISRTKTAADPAQLLSDKQEEQSRRLQEIMIRESPTGLFTASEISTLRDNLTLPDETGNP